MAGQRKFLWLSIRFFVGICLVLAARMTVWNNPLNTFGLVYVIIWRLPDEESMLC